MRNQSTLDVTPYPVTDLSPRPTGNEISWMCLGHNGDEQVLERRTFQFKKLSPNPQLVERSGLLIHTRADYIPLRGKAKLVSAIEFNA